MRMDIENDKMILFLCCTGQIRMSAPDGKQRKYQQRREQCDESAPG